MSRLLKDTVGSNRRHLPRLPNRLLLDRPTAKKARDAAMRRQQRDSGAPHRHLQHQPHRRVPRRPTSKNVQHSDNDYVQQLLNRYRSLRRSFSTRRTVHALLP